MRGQPTLGLLLVRANKITREQLYEALREQRSTGARLGDILYGRGWIGEEELTMLLAQQLGLPFVEAKQLEKLPPPLVSKVPAKIAAEYRVVPVKLFKGKLTVAMDDQKTRNYLDELSYLAGATCVPALASPGAVRRCIRVHYGVELPERQDLLPAKRPQRPGSAASRDAVRPAEKLEALPVARTDASGRDYVELKDEAGGDRVFLLTEVIEESALRRGPLPGPVTERRATPRPMAAPAPPVPADPGGGGEEDAHDNFLAPEVKGDTRPVWCPRGVVSTDPGAREETPAEEIWPEEEPAPVAPPRPPAMAAAHGDAAPAAEPPPPSPSPPPAPVAIEEPLPDFDIVRAAERLFEQTDPSGIAGVIVSFARNLVDRAIVFGADAEGFRVLARAGSFLDDDRGAGFTATAEELVLLGVIARSKQPSYGPTPPGEMYERFFRTLGVMKPPFILLYPLVVAGSTRAVLFGGLGAERPPDEFADLQMLFKEAATAWEILLA